jgi:formylglycine-generating enzyme required for sulfatase activity
LIRIPAGKYQRGARDGEGTDDEKPQHWVQISNGFEVGRFEVTQAIYTKVMGKNPSWFSSTGNGKDKVSGMDTSDFPAESMSWFDALEFCNKLSVLEKLRPYYELTSVQRDADSIAAATVKILGGDGYRLPTEAEWEYVARAGAATIFPWGDSLSSTQANFDGDFPYGSGAKGPNLKRTTKVGSYEPNAWGLCDTPGNVYEWVWDWHGEGEYRQFATTTATDPQGPSTGDSRVVRGGGWSGRGEDCRPAFRGRFAPERWDYFLGFRVARGLSSE